MTQRKRLRKEGRAAKREGKLPLLASMINSVTKPAPTTDIEALHHATEAPMYRELQAAKRHELVDVLRNERKKYIAIAVVGLLVMVSGIVILFR